MSTPSGDRFQKVSADRDAGRWTWRRVFHEHGLTIVLLLVFFACWGVQIVTGRRVYNDERREHGQPIVSLIAYLSTGHFVEATAENWESEFLQMAAFVWLTSCLFQKGSPESKDPYDPTIEEPPLTEKSPWPMRRGGWIASVYGYSLTLAFLLMFLLSFFFHAWGGACAFSEEQVCKGQSPVTLLQYMGESQFWFESFQNWQSEFLSIAEMVVFAIFLRQKGSPESKPLATPHSENE